MVAAEFRVIDCDSDLDLTPVQRVARMLAKGYLYGSHYLPHDAKTKFAPASKTNKPPNTGPIIPAMLNCKLPKVAAEGRFPSETTWRTSDAQAGALMANPLR